MEGRWSLNVGDNARRLELGMCVELSSASVGEFAPLLTGGLVLLSPGDNEVFPLSLSLTVSLSVFS